MTRTGKSARLSAHVAEPYAEINTADALRFAVRDGELATLRSSWGSMVVRVRTGADVPSGMVFAPIHWNRAFASDARVGALTNPVVDPISGEPELKHTPVSIEHFAADWYGVMLTRAAAAAAGHARGGRRCRASSSCATSSPAIESARLVHRGAPVARRAGRRFRRRRRLDRISRSGAARVSRGLVRGRPAARAASTSTGGRRCPSAPGWRSCSRMPKLDAARCAPACWPAAQLEGADQGALVCSCFGVGAQPHRRLRARARRRRHARGNRQAPQVRHQLRFLRAGNPGDHRRGREEVRLSVLPAIW